MPPTILWQEDIVVVGEVGKHLLNRQKGLGLYLDMKLVQGLLRLLMMLPMPLLLLELLQRLAMMLLAHIF